jgi:hypothetical protein
MWLNVLTVVMRRVQGFKTWKFRFYEVKRLLCPKCGGGFNYYCGVSPRGVLSVVKTFLG